MRVNFSNFADYVRLTRHYRYTEFRVQIEAIHRGLSSVLSPSVLSLLTYRELETAVCGRGLGVEGIELLEKMTKYSGCSRHDPHIQLFWKMMKERLTDEQRAQFLIFTYGRSRLPATSADVDTSFTIMRAPPRPAAQAAATSATSAASAAAASIAAIDRQLPTSHTCGFAFELPSYSSLEVMTERILYAVNHCGEIDADGGMARVSTQHIVEMDEEEEEQEDEEF